MHPFLRDIAIEIGFTNTEIKFKRDMQRQKQFKPTHMHVQTDVAHFSKFKYHF